jgi:F-box and leucine-rich repeat protein 2/20
MNIRVLKLDEALHVISKSCCGILQLLLQNCKGITKKGVKHVVKNCTQLREINLSDCDKVHHNVVASMVFSRPSLRKIVAPLCYLSGDKKRELFLRHGCIVEF